jgi:subtilisin family serine protease
MPSSNKLDSGLTQLVVAGEGLTDGALSSSLAARSVPGTQSDELSAGLVRVTLIAQDMADVPTVMQRVEALAGTVETSYRTWVQALVPISSLDQLAGLPQVRLARLPYLPHTMEIISQGVGVSGADAWISAGVTGQGVKVGVLDVGFRGYKELLGKELPPTVVTKSFRRDGKIEPNDGGVEDVHGLGVAEIVHDMAPDAQLYLTNFETDVEFFNALDWLISQKVDVINMSIGFFTGCYGGNGLFDDPTAFSDNQGQVAKARKAGILWVVSAGNEAQEHWDGPWQDQGNTGELNFTSLDKVDTFQARQDDPIFIQLSWDDPCFGANDDYDLFLEDDSGHVLASSTDRQNGGANDSPVEEISLKAPYTGPYKIVVKQIKASHPVRLNLFALGFRLTDGVAAGSLVEPAISANAMTAGAAFWQTERLEPFSSQGPTLDGRTKPDITGVDGVSNTVFNPFYGTSASAPQVTGAAALVKQAFPSFGPDQIQKYLEQHAEDLGPPGKDNQYGAGLLTLGPVPAGVPTVPAPPSDLKANALSSLSIQLSWKDNSNNETGFQIERRLSSSGPVQTLSAKAGTTSFTDAGLNAARTYCYRVLATNGAGNSAFSNQACATTQAALPVITAIEPTQGIQSNSVRAVIEGQLLSNASAVAFSGLGVTAQIEIGGSDSALPITITIAPDAAPGPRTFSVTTSAGTADSGGLTFTVTAQPGVGILVALRFDKLEFPVAGDWSRAVQSGCVIYTNIGKGPSPVRVTLPDGSVQEYEIPAGSQVIACGDVAHIDTRPKKP